MSDSQTRQEFEQSTAFVGYTFSRDYNGDYSDKTTYHAWLGWIAGRSAGLEEAAQIAQGLWNSGPCTCKECAEISTAILKRKEGD